MAVDGDLVSAVVRALSTKHSNPAVQPKGSTKVSFGSGEEEGVPTYPVPLNLKLAVAPRVDVAWKEESK